MPQKYVWIPRGEAEYVRDKLEKSAFGSIGWAIFYRLRFEDTVTVEQADYLATLLQNAQIGSIENNIYERMRKRAHNQRAFVIDRWNTSCNC